MGRYLLSLLFLPLLTTAACSGPASNTPARTSPPSAAELTDWAIGSDSRGDYPDTSDAFLILVPKGQTPNISARVTPTCASMKSLLPAPSGSGSVYVVKDGELHIVRASDPSPAPVKLTGADRALHLVRLLGFRSQASPLEIIAVARPAQVDEVWSITVSDTEPKIVRAEALADTRKPQSVAAFFATYDSPRCQHGGTQCLTVSNDKKQSYVDVRP